MVKVGIKSKFNINEQVQIPYVNGWLTMPIKSFLVKNNKVYAIFKDINPVEINKLRKIK